MGVESPGFQGSFGHFGMVFYSDSVLNGFLSQYVLSQAHPLFKNLGDWTRPCDPTKSKNIVQAPSSPQKARIP